MHRRVRTSGIHWETRLPHSYVSETNPRYYYGWMAITHYRGEFLTTQEWYPRFNFSLMRGEEMIS